METNNMVDISNDVFYPTKFDILDALLDDKGIKEGSIITIVAKSDAISGAYSFALQLSYTILDITRYKYPNIRERLDKNIPDFISCIDYITIGGEKHKKDLSKSCHRFYLDMDEEEKESDYLSNPHNMSINDIDELYRYIQTITNVKYSNDSKFEYMDKDLNGNDKILYQPRIIIINNITLNSIIDTILLSNIFKLCKKYNIILIIVDIIKENFDISDHITATNISKSCLFCLNYIFKLTFNKDMQEKVDQQNGKEYTLSLIKNINGITNKEIILQMPNNEVVWYYKSKIETLIHYGYIIRVDDFDYMYCKHHPELIWCNHLIEDDIDYTTLYSYIDEEFEYFKREIRNYW